MIAPIAERKKTKKLSVIFCNRIFAFDVPRLIRTAISFALVLIQIQSIREMTITAVTRTMPSIRVVIPVTCFNGACICRYRLSEDEIRTVSSTSGSTCC